MLDIIIPVYNAEKYLERCINSVISQTETNWNLILVDDGSTDSSANICDLFADLYNNINVIHKKNNGVSSARNAGIDATDSEFIMFVDADDWLYPELVERLLCKAAKVDMVIGGYTVKSISGDKSRMIQSKHLNISNMGDIFPQMIETDLTNSPFSKIYRRDIIGNQRFDEKVALGEDFLFNLEYFRKCKVIEVIEYDGYIYNCTNENSATKRFREQDIDQIVNLYRKGKIFEEDFCRTKNCSNALEKRLCVNGINMLQLILSSKMSYQKKKLLALKLLDGEEFVKSCYGNYRLPIILEIPRWLCKKHLLMGLRYFFRLKDIGRIIIK